MERLSQEKRRNDCTDISIQLVLFCWNATLIMTLKNIYLKPPRKRITMLILCQCYWIKSCLDRRLCALDPGVLNCLQSAFLSTKNKLHITALILYTLNEHTNGIRNATMFTLPYDCFTNMLNFTFSERNNDWKDCIDIFWIINGGLSMWIFVTLCLFCVAQWLTFLAKSLWRIGVAGSGVTFLVAPCKNRWRTMKWNISTLTI